VIAVIAGLAIAASLIVGWRWWRLHSEAHRAIADLVRVMRAQRPTVGRLSAPFVWASPPSAARGAGDGTEGAGHDTNGGPEAMIAAATIELALARDRSAANLHDYAIAQMVLGRPAIARSALDEARLLTPDAPQIWSDLAVACLESASADNAIDLPRALDAIDLAIALRDTDAAVWFNKALILERLHLRGPTIAAWQHFIDLEPQTPWTTEARAHLAALTGDTSDVQTLRESLFDDVLSRWGDAVIAGHREAADAALQEAHRIVATTEMSAYRDALGADVVAAIAALSPSRRLEAARGHAAYGAARRRYRQEDFERSAPLFASAATTLAAVKSPAAELARLHGAIVHYRRQQYAEALAGFRAVRAAAEHHAYPSLAGRASWVEGLTLETSGLARDATARYEASVRDLRAGGERANASFVLGLLASQFDRLGDPTRAWQAWIEAFQGTTREGPILTAAISATQLGWSHAALDLQHAAIDIARAAGRKPTLADGLRWSAITSGRLGLPDEARRALAEARSIAGDQPGAAWDRVRAEIDVAEAVSTMTSAPAVRIDAASRANAYFQRAQVPARLPEILLARANAKRATGDITGARADLQEGLRVLTTLRHHLAPGVDQMTFSDVVRRLLSAFVDVEDSLGHAREAFDVVDEARARDLAADAAAVSLPSLERAMPDNAALIEFVVGEDHALAWLVRQGGSSVVRLDVTRADLTTLAAAAGPPRFDRDALRRLHARVFATIARAVPTNGLLVIVPDGPLHVVPFAMLPGERAPYLVDEHPIVVGPSARSWLATSDRLTQATSPPSRAFVAGNPAIDTHRYGHLPLLPFAEAEARDVADLYHVSPTLGADVTREAVVHAMSADVVHFAGHAIVNETRPSESELVLGDASGAGLRAAEIRGLDCARTRLIVLASCQGAWGLMTRTEGAIGLARAFLAAGAPSVVASQWMVDDRASSALMVRFHQEYLQTGNAPESLRRAQIALAHAGDAVLREPRNWAGFVAFGGAPTGTARSRHD
jgi:CHAT domain-containing protein/tetratricopeptide (TPR) repeat protein